MLTLQQMTDAWGHWQASRNKTGLNFTASTNYGAQSDLDNWHQYQTGVTIQGIVFDGNTPPTGKTDNYNEVWYDNNTDADQQIVFKKSQTTTESFTWKMTESLEVGVEVGTTVGVPDVASASAKLNIKIGLASEQSGTTGGEQSWEVETPISIPARSSVKADMVIASDSYNIGYTASLFLQGYVAIWYNDRINGHFLWFAPITQVLSECQNNMAAIGLTTDDLAGYSFANGGILAQSRGVFTGSQGISVAVAVNQYPVRIANARMAVAAGVPAPHLLVFAAQ